MSDIPERIEEETRAVYASSPIKVIGELEAGSLISHIAKALLAAEQRGREMERERLRPLLEGQSMLKTDGLDGRLSDVSEQGKGE